MRNFFNLHRFGYSVILSVDVDSLIPYLDKLYEDTEITETAASDCIYTAVDEIPISYRVRVYNHYEARAFRDDCHIYGNWYHSMVDAMVEEIKAMDENQYIFFADDYDELVSMVNAIVDHCKEFGFHGEFSEITLHTRPIDYGYQTF